MVRTEGDDLLQRQTIKLRYVIFHATLPPISIFIHQGLDILSRSLLPNICRFGNEGQQRLLQEELIEASYKICPLLFQCLQNTYYLFH